MMIIFYAALLLGGLVLLWKAGEASILYTQQISLYYKLNTLFLGFVLLAVSTGIPELSIVIQSLLNNVPLLSASDIIGSNFIDLAIVLGIPAFFIQTMYVSKKDYGQTILILTLSTIIMSFIFLSKTMTRLNGIILVIAYLGSCWYLWKTQPKDSSKTNTSDREQQKNQSILCTFTKLGLSLTIILVGSKLCVYSALKLVALTTISLDVIGTTILALGTSLPEITLSIIATKKKDYALAIGNSLGSVVEQGSLLMGILALFSREPIPTRQIIWIAPFFYSAIAIIGLSIIAQKKIGKWSGLLLLLLAIAYFIYGYS